MSKRPWLCLTLLACGRVDEQVGGDAPPVWIAGRDDLRCDGIEHPTWTVDGEPWTGLTVDDGAGIAAVDTVRAGDWQCSDGDRDQVFHVAPARDNTLVILLDDVGVDKVGVYGSAAAPPTPTLDALARSGTRFTQAWGFPVCSPARAALLTGRYAMRTGIGENIELHATEELDTDEEILPEVLARAAVPYDNGIAGKWHLSTDPSHPRRSGFAWDVGTIANPLSPAPGFPGKFDYFEWVSNDNGVLGLRAGYLTTATVDDAIARIADMPEPWVLYLALNASHAPMHVPPADLYTTALDPDVKTPAWYDAVLEAADTEIGRLLDNVDPEVLSRTTIVALGDNGTIAEVDEDPTDGESKGTMFEAGLHVPMIVSSRLVTHPGSTVDAIVHVTDVMPTLAAIAGVDVRELDRPVDGTSLLPYLGDPEYPPLREFMVSERFRLTRDWASRWSTAIREDRYKLVRQQLDDKAVDTLFDLASPQAEELDLLAQPLDADAAGAYARLTAELDRLASTL